MVTSAQVVNASPRSPYAAMAAVARRAASDASVVRWPSARWAHDPVGFAREVLGVELWSAQVEIVESIRDNRNTAVRSGHKVGKSTAIATAALWFYCTFDRARVILTAVKATQIENIIWKEIRRLFREARRRGFPIDGELYELARTGLRAEDERQIFGLTARDGEGLAGISSPNILVLADEASGIADRFFEVLGTSLASDGGTVRKCYISNPTRTVGEFYRSHTTNKHLFRCIAISSEDTPNARGTGRVKGLAGPDWIEEKRVEYGEDSPQFRVRVKGEFAHDLEGKVISLDVIAAAEERWEDADEDGQLQIGVDPAGDGVGGDETAIAVRRGQKVRSVLAWQKLSLDGIVSNILGLLADNRRAREARPRVVVDANGIGDGVAVRLRFHLEKHPEAFDLIAIRSHFAANDRIHDKVRDALWGNMATWVKAEGSALPSDAKLAQELNTPSWDELKDGKARVTDKDKMRSLLGRSPDRADAVCLAVWGFGSLEAPEAPHVPPGVASDDHDDDRAPSMNPYDGLAAWGG